jgi:OOP family OmpA-OmpF porin
LPTFGSLMLGVMVSAAAAADDNNGWYVGANAGQSRAKIDDPRIAGDLLEEGFDTTALKNDDLHLGYKLFGGYQFVKYFALEAGYFDLGKFGFTANTLPPVGLTGHVKLQGADIDAVAILPFTPSFAAFGRIGYDYAFAKDAFAGSGDVIVQDPERREHGGNYKFGLGLQYQLTRLLGLRAEGERYRVDDGVGNKGDIDLYSVGVVFRFGASAPPPVARAVAAEPAAPEPAPAPVTPPPPPPPPPKRVSFSADELFDFGKQTLRPAAKEALDGFARELQDVKFRVITVTGHTDRIGSPEYNVKLSQRRAEAVKSYLVDAAGIPADVITARGADGSDPVTKPDDCKGRRRTPKLIACLQPDRRVDVEVIGTESQTTPATK